MLLDKPLLQITEADLQALCDNKVLEGRTIDYKARVSLDNDKDKDDFRADLCSFANTVGGDIIFGIPEKDGLPKTVEGLDDPNPDAVKQKLESIRSARVEPSMPGVHMHQVCLSNGKWCLVVRVDKSWTPPHAVVRSDSMRCFWGRHSAGKYPLDLPTIRAALNIGHTSAERIRTFRIDRVNKISAGETPVRTGNGGKLIYHLIPFDAFETAQPYDLVTFSKSGGRNSLLQAWAYTFRYNLDGLLGHTRDPRLDQESDEPIACNYVQVFRSGIIEAVDANYFSYGGTQMSGPYTDRRIVEYVGYLVAALETLKVRLPVVVFFTIIGAKGQAIVNDTQHFGSRNVMAPIDRDVLPLPEVVLQDYCERPEDLLKPALDALWQSGGWERSMTYSETGEWLPPR